MSHIVKLLDALRRGMSPAARETPAPAFRVVPIHSGFVPGVDPLKLNQLNDRLKAEEDLVNGGERIG